MHSGQVAAHDGPTDAKGPGVLHVLQQCIVVDEAPATCSDGIAAATAVLCSLAKAACSKRSKHVACVLLLSLQTQLLLLLLLLLLKRALTAIMHIMMVFRGLWPNCKMKQH
jgi:hypothetical protein